MRATRRQTVFVRWWPLELRMLTQHRDVVQWVHHHLATVAELVDPPVVRHTVRAVVDPGLLAAAGREITAKAVATVEPYSGDLWVEGTLDGRRAWTRRQSVDDPSRALVLVDDAGGHWSVIAADTGETGRGVVRLARELLRTELAGRGAFTCHAACAYSDRFGGVLVAGSSGAGKTTLALAAARTGYLVSGDQTEILASEEGPIAAGFPWSHRIWRRTLHQAGVDPSVERWLLRTQRSGPATASAQRDRAAKLELTPSETSLLLRTPVAAACPLDTVVVLDRVPGRSAPRAVLVDPPAAFALLAGHLREPDPSFGTFWLARPGARPTEAQDPAGLEAVLTNVRVASLAWEPARHSALEALDCLGDCLSTRGQRL
ncbi:hypothetical protein [Streptomyces sp. NPDC002520]